MLFVTIASVVIQSMVRNKIDFSDSRNTIIASVMLTIGVGGAVLNIGSFSLGGIGLAALVGVLLNLLLPKTKKTERAEVVKAEE